MAKVFQFMANGFEDIEALIPVDIFRRGGVDIKTVSITDSNIVESAHGVKMHADLTFKEAEPMLEDADLLMLPGGMPGATNLDAHEGLKSALLRQADKGRMIAAICAAPLVLGGLGLLRGRRATCYPGFEQTLTGAEYTAELVTIDGNITTGEGPAAALPYAYSLLEQLTDSANSLAVAGGMRYLHLMEK
ncbi:MAG: DJ-1 family glyoxalase III [Prevotella sp.]|uniref:DJ-1 family glyoxalase III n=1 Tax=Prevotella sp. TaxID=59823 RepID=UPI002A29750E|nr:DJ-1 family glyoxalase III [Prevotella sp.]MDD7317739.1 DJ-1/PfpI family protein [Prevotellaceae bacterium]MDY4020654.1 DJ-1 family glyoxalase III [Prevotella sp.]